MPNYDLIQLAPHSDTLYTCTPLKSVAVKDKTPQMHMAGSVVWPSLTMIVEDPLTLEEVTTEVRSPYAKLVDGAYVDPTAEEIAAYQAALAGVEQAAQLAELAKLDAAIGDTVAAIQQCLVVLGRTLPCDSAQTTAELTDQSLSGLLTDEQERAKGNLADLYIILSGQGVTDDQIAAAHAYREEVAQ